MPWQMPRSTPARPRWAALSLAAVLACGLTAAVRPAAAAERFITLASTTSTQNSGLFDWLLPKFTARTGIQVHVVAVGTGQAFRLGERGDADVLLVHDRQGELKFVAEGHGVERRDVMYNDFVIVGPGDDPAGVAGGQDAVAALARIAGQRAPFASRADDSGTHRAELKLWAAAGVDPRPSSGTWYKETGSGMGATLNTAAAMGAYALTDRGSWANFKNRRGLKIVIQGDARLFNPYGVMLVNPAKFAHVKREDGMAFIRWITAAEGQQAVRDYQIGGEHLFFPNYKE
jgi:tungstate transport system substrate-binding protein